MLIQDSNGFLSVLGSLPLQFAMFLTIIAAVRIERNEEGEWDSDGLEIYTWVWIKHLVLFTVLALNMYYSKVLGLSKNIVNTCAMIFEVLILMYVCVRWAYPDAVEQAAAEEASTSTSAETVSDNPDEEAADEVQIEHPSLRFWLELEVLMFCANVVSNIVFLALRSCSRRRLDLTPSIDSHSTGDTIDEQQVLMGLVSSYITPFFVTYCFMKDEWKEYEDLDDTVKSLLNFMFAIQALQAVLVLCIALRTYPSRNVMLKDSRISNRCVEISHYVLSVFLFVILPVVVIIGYLTVFAPGVTTGPMFTYLTFYAILTVLLQVWFFASLIDIFERLKQDNANKEQQKDDVKFLEALSEKGKVEKSLILREDMYSLCFTSLVKPQYKRYCDFVAETGQTEPAEVDEPEELEHSFLSVRRASLKEYEETTWSARFKSFICFQAPKTERLATPEVKPVNKNDIASINSTRQLQSPNESCEVKEGNRTVRNAPGGNWTGKDLLLNSVEARQRQAKKSSHLAIVFFLMVTQLFSALALLGGLANSDYEWHLKPTSVWTVTMRFVCGFVLHIYLQSELLQGFTNMKFALNHPWKFENPKLAFLIGFAQASVIFVIEGVHYLLLLGNDEILTIVVNFLALVFISQFDDFFYGTHTDQEFKRVIRGLSDRYADFLRVQTTSSYRCFLEVDTFKTQPQKVETISPLKEEVQDAIPEYVRMGAWKNRSCCNRFLWIVYRVMRIQLMSVWLYFIPFIALAMSFAVPYYFEPPLAPIVQGESMDQAYEDYLKNALAERESNYEEPTVDELVEMMSAVPYRTEEWRQGLDVQIVPLSLEQYWDAYWSDDAPYYLMSLSRDPEDQVYTSTPWKPPSEDYRTLYDGTPSFKERYIERDMRIHSSIGPDYCDYHIYASLVEKTETKIQIIETQYSTNCPFSDRIRVQVQWDIMTPDPLSQQTIYRMTYFFRWGKKPIFWKIIENTSEKGLANFGEKLKAYFQDSALLYLQGEPYQYRTHTDGQFFWTLDDYDWNYTWNGKLKPPKDD